MLKFIIALLLFISISGSFAYTTTEIGTILNTTASNLGFQGKITYNADTGNMFVLPDEGYDLNLDTFCRRITKAHPWLYVGVIFKAGLDGNHVAYECQRVTPEIEIINPTIDISI